MPRLTPRNRVVVFRVAQEEYRLPRHTCVQRDRRNLSEFTRSELLSMLRTAGESDGRVAALERKLSSLQCSVEYLVRLVEGAVVDSFRPTVVDSDSGRSA